MRNPQFCNNDVGGGHGIRRNFYPFTGHEEGGVIEGFSVGIETIDNGTEPIRDVTFYDNGTDIDQKPLHDLGPININIENIDFGEESGTGIDPNIYFAHAHPYKLFGNSVRITLDGEKIYSAKQDPDFVPFEDTGDIHEMKSLGDVPGIFRLSDLEEVESEIPGKTNAELQAEYGTSIQNELTPPEAESHPHISGGKVGGSNESPSGDVTVEPESVLTGETVTAEATGLTDSDGSIDRVFWTFGNGERATGESVTTSFDETGDHEVTAHVIDDDGASELISETVHVDGPRAVFSTTKEGGTTVSFDASESNTPEGTVTTYEWEFGDGSTASGETVEHTFEIGGFHEIVIEGLNDQVSDYEFSVSGAVAKGEHAGGPDDVEGNTVSGQIVAGKDRYLYEGEITSWSLEEAVPVTITIDGEEVDPSTLGQAGGSGGSDADKSVTVAPGGSHEFSPADLTVEPGTTVTFNWDAGGHTVTVDSQPDDANWSGVDSTQSEGHTLTHTFEVEGTYEYHCQPHKSQMQGTITVDGSESISEAIDEDEDGDIDDDEILTALDHWQDNDPVPGTDGQTISDTELLDLVDSWQDSGND